MLMTERFVIVVGARGKKKRPALLTRSLDAFPQRTRVEILQSREDRHERENGKRESTCRFCEKRITGSRGRHLAHFDPDDSCVAACIQAPEATLIHVNEILREANKRREAKKRVAEVAQLAAADRTIRKQIRIDHQCNTFAGEEVDDKLAGPWCRQDFPSQ